MSDQELRRLEREAEGGGGPTARLAWAHALRRAGRDDDAIAALRPAAAGPALGAPAGADVTQVRAELARVPAWTHPGGPGGAAALDVRPVRAAPRVRWVLPDPDAGPFARQDGVLGGPLGLVTCRGALLITVLDPETGAVRATTPVGGTGAPPRSLAGEVLFVHCDERAEVRAIHAWNDVDLYQLPLSVERGAAVAWDVRDPTRQPGPPRPLGIPADLRHDHPIGGTAQADGLLLAHGRLGPGVTRPSFWIGDSLSLRAGPEVVLASLWTNHVNVARHAGLDRATGAVRWTAPGTVVAVDARGVATAHLREVTLRGPTDGAARWTFTAAGDARVAALGEALVLVREATTIGAPTTTLRALDRGSGAPLFELGQATWRTPVALARDVIYRGDEGGLAAFGADGAPRWRVDLAALARERGLTAEGAGQAHTLVPMTGRLVVKTGDGTVWCLEG